MRSASTGWRRDRGLAPVVLLLLAIAAAPAFAQPAEPPEPADDAQEHAGAIVWEAPEGLREIFEKHIALPEAARADARRGALRPFLREVRRRVPEISAAEGYFSAKVTTRIEGEGEERRLYVNVEPGARTLIERVIVEFEGDIAGAGEERGRQREDVRASWTLPAGRPFRQADWDDAKARILEKLSERHYAAASMADSAALVDAPAARATLKVILESGPRFTTGAVVVEGLKRYPEELVRRYSPFKPGDAWEQERVLTFQRLLQNTPFFASVLVDVERDPAAPHEVPVRVTVIERAPADVGLSLGYGTDTGVRGEVSYRHRNIFGHALDMHSAIAVDKTRQVGYADFYLPPLALGGPLGDRLDTRDSFGVLFEAKSNQGLDTERVAFAAYRQFKLRPPDDYRVGLSYQFERKKPEGADESIARALAPEAEATWRFVDSVIDPKSGGVLRVRIAGAGWALSTQEFLYAYAHYQHWFPLTADDQVILRAEVGRTIAPSRDGIPENFLFRAGGTRSNRGYAYESLGVQDGSATVGGRHLATGSAEYVHWFNRAWGGALFVDVGDAVDQPNDFSANASYGLGARWRTPAGPLAFDLAYAENQRKWRLSFSVSVAF